ncbi:DUF3189 family protein [Thermoanaerobacterium thermosaccharolyticum]|uniref:DUF3189 family protein n=1 Tax=Thermoanaerobacterium thermosaccharolyticum TaxID=1517 RepID=UPI0027A679D6|nr:DUF3189 family protein [Thermoanaerobacterium thermosaccharolyticum]
MVRLKVIYYSYFGCYSSVIAAYIHTKIIKDKVDKDVFFSIPEILKTDYGELKYIGIDESYHEIYTIGMKNYSDNIKKTLEGFRKIFNMEYDKLIFVDTSKFEPKCMKLFLYLRKTSIFRNLVECILYYLFVKKLDRMKNFVLDLKLNYM